MTNTLCSLVAKRVRFHRNDLGLSRRVLSEQTDISERYLAQLEAGKANISLLLLERIANALDLALTDLVKTGKTTTISKSLSEYLSKLSGDEQAQTLTFLKQQKSRIGADHKCIALIGMRGAGKSALGKKFARDIKLPFVRLSDRIAENSGMDINTLIESGGSAAYRKEELKALKKLVHSPSQKVLEVSGGITDSPASYKLLLENFHTVYIKAQPEEHVKRVAGQPDVHLMETGPEPIKFVADVILKRDPMYQKADLTVDTSGQSEAKSLSALKKAVEKSKYLQ